MRLSIRHLSAIAVLAVISCFTSTEVAAQASTFYWDHGSGFSHSTISVGYLMNNMDEMLEMEAGSNRGFQVGYEYTLGQQFGLSLGAYFQHIAGAFNKIPEYSEHGVMGEGEAFTIYGFKVPLMAGLRSEMAPSLQYRLDAGIQWHLGYITSHSAPKAQGLMPERQSVALALRGGIGFHRFMINAQYEKGVSRVFKDMDGYYLDILSISAAFSF